MARQGSIANRQLLQQPVDRRDRQPDDVRPRAFDRGRRNAPRAPGWHMRPPCPSVRQLATYHSISSIGQRPKRDARRRRPRRRSSRPLSDDHASVHVMCRVRTAAGASAARRLSPRFAEDFAVHDHHGIGAENHGVPASRAPVETYGRRLRPRASASARRPRRLAVRAASHPRRWRRPRTRTPRRSEFGATRRRGGENESHAKLIVSRSGVRALP